MDLGVLWPALNVHLPELWAAVRIWILQGCLALLCPSAGCQMGCSGSQAFVFLCFFFFFSLVHFQADHRALCDFLAFGSVVVVCFQAQSQSSSKPKAFSAFCKSLTLFHKQKAQGERGKARAGILPTEGLAHCAQVLARGKGF